MAGTIQCCAVSSNFWENRWLLFFKYFGVAPERIASFDSFEKNQNPRRVVSFSYFKSLKELIVFLKELAKNQRFSDQLFDFSCFLRTMVSLYSKPNSLNLLRTGRQVGMYLA